MAGTLEQLAHKAANVGLVVDHEHAGHARGDSRRVGSPEVALVADPRVAVPRESDFRPGHTAFTPKTHPFPAFAVEV